MTRQIWPKPLRNSEMLVTSQLARAQGDAHGGSHADGRSAAHDHGANGVGDGFVVGAVDPDLLGRQLGLVNE